MNEVSVDSDALADLRLVMEDEFPILLQTFIKDSDERIALLQALTSKEAEVSDADAIRGCAHSFKGSSSNLGALKLAEICRKVEAAGLSGDLESVDQLMSQIDAEYKIVRRELNALL